LTHLAIEGDQIDQRHPPPGQLVGQLGAYPALSAVEHVLRGACEKDSQAPAPRAGVNVEEGRLGEAVVVGAGPDLLKGAPYCAMGLGLLMV
jgi:hypothetical protein